MTTSTPTPGALIELDGAANCRDLGGWPVAGGGTVRRGLVFRSSELNGLSDRGLSQLESLGLRTVYDLRTTAERNAQPDRLPGGVDDVHLDVLASDPSSAAAGVADLSELLADPKRLEGLLGDMSVTALFERTYRDVVGLPSAISAYRTMYAGIADAAARPVLFHCTTGKDRTGWGAAALLTFLGVSADDVTAEYLLTNDEILALTQPMYDTFAKAGGDPDLLRPALGVDASYLEAAFDEMTTRFGSIEGYFSQGLGLDDATLDALRGALVEPAG
jgi:protein-tyrosine phosphatase